MDKTVVGILPQDEIRQRLPAVARFGAGRQASSSGPKTQGYGN